MNWLLVIGHWSLVTGLFFQVLVACGLIYSLLIGFFTIGWYRRSAVGGRRPVLKAEPEGSAVSVIVAARNEESRILNLLGDLLLQDYPEDMLEIIVVDDNSTDNTSRIVSDFIQKHNFPRILILKNSDDKSLGKKAAIDLGIEHAKGDIIITTDADCRVGKSWISAMVNAFRNDTRMVFGPVSYFEECGITAKFQSLEFLGLIASGAGAALAGHPFMCNGANLAYRKDSFLKVKGFEGNDKYLSGDDVFLLHKMKKEFGKKSVIFNENADSIVKTYPAPNLKKFLSQRIRWASKSKGYKDALSIITAIVVFSYSLTVLLALIAGFFEPLFFLAFGGLLLIKMIADFPLMLGITRFTGQRRLMRWYLPFQLVYPVYIVAAGLGSFFGRKKW